MSTPLKITPELSKAARRELSLSQSDVIKATGIQGYKLKQFEARGMDIELSDLRKLAEFYEGQGLNLPELAEHMTKPALRQHDLPEGFTATPRPGFAISEHLPPELVERLVDKMGENDKLIGALIKEEIVPGFLRDHSEETETKVREMFGKLAENYLLFRLMQGRNLIEPTRDEPKTIGDLLAKWVKEDPSAAKLLAAVPSAKKGSKATTAKAVQE